MILQVSIWLMKTDFLIKAGTRAVVIESDEKTITCYFPTVGVYQSVNLPRDYFYIPFR